MIKFDAKCLKMVATKGNILKWEPGQCHMSKCVCVCVCVCVSLSSDSSATTALTDFKFSVQIGTNEFSRRKEQNLTVDLYNGRYNG